MTKVLHVIRNVGDGGTEGFMMNVILKMNNENIKHIILSYGNITNWQKELKDNNIKVIKIDEPSKVGLLKNIINICKIIKEEKVDILHSYTYLNSGYVTLAGFIMGVKKRITHSHRTKANEKNSISYKIYKIISKVLINIFSNYYLACDEEAGKSLFYSKKKIIVLKNGINIDKYKFNIKKRNILRKDLNIDKDTIVLGTVGRLDDNKNQKFLIDIFKSYHHNNSNSKLIIIGDGIRKKELTNQVKKLKLCDDVLFLGSRNDVNELYNIMDLFLLTSYNEGLPFVLIEAQTNGLKCMVSDSVSRNSNISNSIIFKSIKDPCEEWSKTISKLDFSRLDSISLIEKSGYSIDTTVKELENIYIK